MIRIRCMPFSTRSVLCKRIVNPLSYHGAIKNFVVSSYMGNCRTFTSMGTKKHCEATFTQCNSIVEPVLGCGCAKRFFTTTSLVSNSGNAITSTNRMIGSDIPQLPFAFATHPSQGRRFSSGCCLTRYTVAIASVAYHTSFRAMHVRGKATDAEQGSSHPEGSEREHEETEDGRKSDGKKARGGQRARARTFRDHIRGLKEDYMKFPDIYNSANAINFVIFTVFCLCSTGSNTEEKWWMDRWGLDNTFHPSAWLLHSFLCQNFLAMTYAMILLHTMCHAMLPTVGSRGLLIYVSATAAISGLIVWLGNRLYYGPHKPAPEKQFGPWDVVSALFVMEYLHYGVTPITILNSFNSWIRYAVWVGEICVLCLDWQTTVVGTAVGLALCKGVPRFRVAKVTGV
ncbi:unnamed protein product [Phytomonas sp. EM1]|nr:unnamed protein product [Phytomonas sp. EM1]|eukprot:CCW63587.1 unnamed protein product [Phytomonas sp. isolate EM1]